MIPSWNNWKNSWASLILPSAKMWNELYLGSHMKWNHCLVNKRDVWGMLTAIRHPHWWKVLLSMLRHYTWITTLMSRACLNSTFLVSIHCNCNSVSCESVRKYKRFWWGKCWRFIFMSKVIANLLCMRIEANLEAVVESMRTEQNLHDVNDKLWSS